MTKPDQYRRWFEYERDAHRKVIDSLRNVPESARGSEACTKAISLIAHIAAGRRLWLYRMGVAALPPQEFFPRVSLDEAVHQLGSIEQEWARYFERLDDAEIARTFDYRSYEGDWFRNRVEDILAQLFGHSSYHRGQIALLLRQAGAEPAVTDFLFWTREAIAEPRGS